MTRIASNRFLLHTSHFKPLALTSAAAIGAAMLGAAVLAGSGAREPEAWARALDDDGVLAQSFEPFTSESARVVATRAETGAEDLRVSVGDRVTLVTADGTLHVLRVCDANAPETISAKDCLIVRSLRLDAVKPAGRERSL
jgi:hypothetical protein